MRREESEEKRGVRLDNCRKGIPERHGSSKSNQERSQCKHTGDRYHNSHNQPSPRNMSNGFLSMVLFTAQPNVDGLQTGDKVEPLQPNLGVEFGLIKDNSVEAVPINPIHQPNGLFLGSNQTLQV
jgi:hypothetical protein